MTRNAIQADEAGRQKRRHPETTKSKNAKREWTAPITPVEPCGPDLEYDHEFVVLFASTVSRQDVQYGSFVGAAAPINWGEVERDCRRLLSRTRDIRVAVLFTRCRTRVAGASGLAEGLGQLAAWLQTFPEQVHPCEGNDCRPAEVQEMRMNALLELVDPEGLMTDVREIVLAKSTAARLQLRDVERAFAFPRPADALSPESIALQLHDLKIRQPEMMTAFEEALSHLGAIDKWSGERLADNQPDFAPLLKLLEPLRLPVPTEAEGTTTDESPAVIASTEVAEHRAPEEEAAIIDCDDQDESQLSGTKARGTCSPLPSSAPPQSILNDRQSALESIRAARVWFELHEPSSPIPVLLKRAEALVGRRYSETVTAIPAELLAEWDV
jgi:type VI secretion system protein ImpA